ncbi:MAG: GNAT family N-acetyltransferase [Chloroflexi bacterium]|nr:GNAT family N-acetyltransferase [Chloroflexota bacterium]
MTPVLETERLLLRRLELSDALRVQTLAGDYQVARTTLTMPHPYPDGAAAEFILRTQQEMAEGSAYPFAIALKSENQLIGVVGLHPRHDYQRAEIGYWIGVPYWNKGYATEAARRVLRFGFEELKLHRIHAAHFTNNPASGRIMQKIGMQYEGTFRQHFIRFGDFMDVAYYAILRSEWSR